MSAHRVQGVHQVEPLSGVEDPSTWRALGPMGAARHANAYAIPTLVDAVMSAYSPHSRDRARGDDIDGTFLARLREYGDDRELGYDHSTMASNPSTRRRFRHAILSRLRHDRSGCRRPTVRRRAQQDGTSSRGQSLSRSTSPTASRVTSTLLWACGQVAERILGRSRLLQPPATRRRRMSDSSSSGVLALRADDLVGISQALEDRSHPDRHKPRCR